MFRSTEFHRVTWPITINKPADGGKLEKHKLDAILEIIPTDQVEELLRTGELLERVFVGLSEKTPVYPEAGDDPLDFETAKKALMRTSYVRAALLDAYFQASSGREAQQKN